MSGSWLKWATTTLLLAICAGAAPPSFSETRRVAPGPEYRKGAFHRFWFGSGYRDLWATEIDIEVLDLAEEAGGLTANFRVGGMQTPGLALAGADGRSYSFRALNKDHRDMLPAEWEETFLAALAQDQVSASHPGAFPVINGMIEGIPWFEQFQQRLVILPDDPALGEFRDEFADMIGTFGEYPMPAAEGRPGFLGATEIISTRELWSRWLDGPENRIDDEMLLYHRIGDIWTGNWDRHSKQWRWAAIPGQETWRPIPEDPDQEFADYRGVLMGLARLMAPQLLKFGDEVSGMRGVAFNGSDIDRWLLTELDRETFLQATRELQSQFDDEVIEKAVRRLPPEWYELNGEELTQRLRRRRETLLDAADRYYHHLAREVSVHATDADDLLRIRRLEDGSVELTLEETGGSQEPFYRRLFVPTETRAVRVYLHGGDDQAIAEGPAKSKIRVYVIGGPGDDRLDDSGGGRTRFHDFEGDNEVREGRGTRWDDRPYENPAPVEHNPWLEPKDYGSAILPLFLIDWNADYGVILRGVASRTAWSFRKFPHDNLQTLALSYSTGRSKAALNYSGNFRRRNSDFALGAEAQLSGIGTVNFFGFGNETERDPELDDEDFYKAEEGVVRLAPLIEWEPSPRRRFYFGPEFQYTDETSTGTLIEQLQPYGAERFNQLGLLVGYQWDSWGSLRPGAVFTQVGPEERKRAGPEPRTGSRAYLEASFFPGLWDVESSFGALEGEISGNLGLGRRERTVVAARLGGRTIWGDYPWHEAAFIGGQDSNRGFALQRFAGDSSLYGGVELRQQLTNRGILLPGRWWIFALADVGRVWFEGESSDEWHPTYGGGVVVELAATPIKLRLEGAKNADEGDLKIYFKTGFAF